MKVLRNSAAWIEGKKYPIGSTIPQKYEKEFEKFLVDVPDLPAGQAGPSPKKDTPKESTKTK